MCTPGFARIMSRFTISRKLYMVPPPILFVAFLLRAANFRRGTDKNTAIDLQNRDSKEEAE